MKSGASGKDRPGTATSAVHAGCPAPRPGQPVVQNRSCGVPPFTGRVPRTVSRSAVQPVRQQPQPDLRGRKGRGAGGHGSRSRARERDGRDLLDDPRGGRRRRPCRGEPAPLRRHPRAARPRAAPDAGSPPPSSSRATPPRGSAALTPRTRVVLIELPTNPTLRVFDIGPARRAARSAGAILAADMTFATPVNIRAAEHGVDAVIHSATKYLGGHSDLIAGVVAGSRS